MLPKIAIVGYGQMGKQIESLAKNQSFEVSEIFDIENPLKDGKFDFDVAIDFTFPDTVFENTRILAENGKNIVLGTTGWYHREDELRSIIEEAGVGLVWGSNFSIGVNSFFSIVKAAAKVMDKFDSFDTMLHEMHHMRKKDSPSGTAESLAKIIIEELQRKDKIETGRIDGEIDSNTLHVSSTRGGEVFGRHTVYFDSKSDSIELSHRAKSREGFAQGSLEAAKWIHGKSGFFDFQYAFNQMITNK